MEISKEIWTVILSIIASLIGGGAIVWITLPLVIKKSRAELLQMEIEADLSALTVAKEATNQVKEAKEDLKKAVEDGEKRDEKNQKKISDLQKQITELQRRQNGPFLIKTEKKILTYPTLVILSEKSTIELAELE